jgi:dienelactone hydrolase
VLAKPGLVYRYLLDGAQLAVRSAATPAYFGMRWIGDWERRTADWVLPAWSDVLLQMKVAADEIFFATELLVGMNIGAFMDGHRVRREVDAAIDLFEEHGWLERPEAYHRPPPPLAPSSITPDVVNGMPFEHLCFESGWAPWDGEPGARRWMSYEANLTGHVRLFRHTGAPRPWVVCVPAYRMGHLLVDVTGFRVHWLHERLGLNVAIPVQPFHGPRTHPGTRGGDGYLCGDFVDTLHAQAQMLWDLRRLVAWLRGEHGAPRVGVYGVSLGACTAAALAALEERLDCVVVGIPAVDFVDLLHSHIPPALVRATERLGFPWERIPLMLRVVSPLALTPRVEWSRRFIFGGRSDTLTPPRQTLALWEHWERPRLLQYRGGHVSFLVEREVRDLLIEAFARTGLLPTSE